MKSKTKIEKQTKKKTNSELVQTINEAKNKKEWKSIAEILSYPRRKRPSINLNKIGEKIKEKEIAVIPGKVLSEGEINKKNKIVAFNFSKKSKEKLLKAGCEISSILEEIKKNPQARGIRILT